MIYQVWSPVQSLYNISYERVIEYECNLHNIATLKIVNVHTWERYNLYNAMYQTISLGARV